MIIDHERHASRAADIVETVRIEGKVEFLLVDENAVHPDSRGVRPLADVSDFILADEDVVGIVVRVDALVAAVLDNESLDRDKRGVEQVEVGVRSVTGGTRRGVARVEDRHAAVLSFEGDRIAGRA